MFTFPAALYPRPKDLKIAALNNKLCNINYSSHKSSNSILAKHTFTTIPGSASLLLPCSPVPKTGFAGSLHRQLSHKCYVPHVCARLASHRSCFHMLPPLLRWMLWLLPYESHGEKKKKESGEARDFKAIILSPVCPLRHITHKPHVANSHDSSRSTRLDYVITTFQAVHPFRHIHRFLHCPSGSPPGKVRGWNRYQTSSTLVLQTWGSTD